jgi:hypothetical protein
MTAPVGAKSITPASKKVSPECQFSGALFVCVGDPQRVSKEEAMKITGMAVMAVMGGISVSADTVPENERQVMVCMAPTADIRLENRAKAVSSRIFAGIGVKIQWHVLSKCPTEGILVTFSNETPASLLPGALAYALPYEGTHIVVFYDRVKKKPGNGSCLLGHVIAHEVTHILQGVARHSESGVMKANWTAADYLQMTWEPLQFARQDVSLIQHGLTVRGPASR